MAIGSELSDYREPVLGLAGAAPDSWHRVGVLSRLLGRSKDLQSAAAVDFESGKAFGGRVGFTRGPLAVGLSSIHETNAP